VRYRAWWCLGGLFALALVAAPPTTAQVGEPGGEPVVHACCLESDGAGQEPADIVAPEEMAASAMASGIARVQGESRPRLRALYYTPHFVLNYTDEPDNPNSPALDDADGDSVPDYIQNLGSYLERAWTLYTTDLPDGMGYAPPPLRDGARYPVLVYQLAPGYSGQTWVDSKSGRRATSHISISAHLSEPYVRAVAAHELFHAVQYGYNYTASFWWKEASADWASSQVFPDVDTYIIPYYDWFQVPYWSLDFADGWHEYGSSIWAQHLAQTRGREIIRAIWLNQRTENDSLVATETALEALGTTLANQFQDFAVWNWFTGDRADGAHYAQGQTYPMMQPTDQAAGAMIPLAGTLRRVSSLYVPLIPPTGTPMIDRGLTVRVKLEDGTAAQLILERTDGTRSTIPVTVPRYHIPDFEQNYRRVVLVLSNADTDASHKYSGSTTLGTVYRDQYGYIWDLQVSWNGAVKGTVEVGDEQAWPVTGEIRDGAFHWRAVNPDVKPGERWVTGFDAMGSFSTAGAQDDRWTNDAGRTDNWNGAALDGPIPARWRVDRRGPAQG
jgi:uncharacterized protein DUF6055